MYFIRMQFLYNFFDKNYCRQPSISNKSLSIIQPKWRSWVRPYVIVSHNLKPKIPIYRAINYYTVSDA